MQRPLVLVCLLLTACSRSVAPVAAPTGPASSSRAPSAVALVVSGSCSDLPIDSTGPAAPADPGAATDDASDTESQPQAEPPGDTSMPIAYDVRANTIALGKGAPSTLPALSRALGRPDLLRELAPGEWLLTANLRIGKDVSLRIAGPEARRLKLRSDAAGFVWIKAFGSQLSFDDTCVTSWDPDHNSVDENTDDGRSFVLARDGARMDIRDSELSYLGYFANESYGVAWRLPGTTGQAINSRFGHNFYGLYSYAASDLVIRGSEIHHSVRYGIDPHTRSNRLLIEGNVSHHNGKQGIILAEECDDSVIRANTVYSNSLHGIVLYQRSNNNLVEGNISYGNGLQGINVNDAAHNTIRGNTTYDNAEAGIGVGQNAAGNLLIGNIVRDNRKDGITFYSDATQNQVQENIVRGNARYGIYVKSENNLIGDGNQVFDNAVGIYLNVARPPQVSQQANRIYGNREAEVRVQP